jgi:hypothetical protein
MEINRENYERYFIDYLDGKLTGTGKEDLLDFLGKNPDLMEELKSLENMVLVPAEEVYPGKPLIRKTLIALMNKKNLSFDELCAASLEGDLPDNENGILISFLKRDEIHRREFDLLKKTILVADTTVTYPDKRVLKHVTFAQRIRIFYITVSAAAAILLTILLVIRPWENHSDRIIAGEQEIIQPVPQDQAEKQSPGNTTVIPSGKINVTEIVTADNTEAERISNLVILDKENLNLGKVLSRNADPLHIAENNYYYTVQRCYTREIVGLEEYLKPAEFLTGLFREKILKQEQPDQDQKISLWELADAGMQGLSNLSSGQFDIDRSYDSEGRMNHFTLETPVFGISAPIAHRNIPE